ncbi:uncharacterized protein LOC129590519 [Paramacrobiotus metropolitanus]|uniref:uncharacterized protein LOC129590519 n=1 Tax=Paramacrobiotus metropolitanus TaxID=2943436 RepID=UPI002445E24F|nr:uncharacterized protein LOC129590519 [Paramacrobiotus metropolitanus]
MTREHLCIFAFVLTASLCRAAVFNSDARYNTWQKLFPTDPYTRIPVYIDTAAYAASGDTTTVTNINNALLQMNTDLNGCIQFIVLPSSTNVGRDFMWISNAYNNGTVSTTCATVPGHEMSQAGRGQKLLIVGGTGAGKCGSSQRQIMGKLANTLTLRNEYQRPDRPIAVTINNIDPSLSGVGAGMYSQYSSAIIQVYPFNPTYDFNSITQISPQTNAAAGQTMFTNPGGQATPTQARLSAIDCAALAWKYGCSIACQDPFG